MDDLLPGAGCRQSGVCRLATRTAIVARREQGRGSASMASGSLSAPRSRIRTWWLLPSRAGRREHDRPCSARPCESGIKARRRSAVSLRSSPLLCVFDDAQWPDQSSLRCGRTSGSGGNASSAGSPWPSPCVAFSISSASASSQPSCSPSRLVQRLHGGVIAHRRTTPPIRAASAAAAPSSSARSRRRGTAAGRACAKLCSVVVQSLLRVRLALCIGHG